MTEPLLYIRWGAVDHVADMEVDAERFSIHPRSSFRYSSGPLGEE